MKMYGPERFLRHWPGNASKRSIRRTANFGVAGGDRGIGRNEPHSRTAMRDDLGQQRRYGDHRVLRPQPESSQGLEMFDRPHRSLPRVRSAPGTITPTASPEQRERETGRYGNSVTFFSTRGADTARKRGHDGGRANVWTFHQLMNVIEGRRWPIVKMAGKGPANVVSSAITRQAGADKGGGRAATEILIGALPQVVAKPVVILNGVIGVETRT